jgi:hypothetical protein
MPVVDEAKTTDRAAIWDAYQKSASELAIAFFIDAGDMEGALERYRLQMAELRKRCQTLMDELDKS